MVSSSWRARELEAEVMAFEVGSRRIGRRVKLSGSSMVIFFEWKMWVVSSLGDLACCVILCLLEIDHK